MKCLLRINREGSFIVTSEQEHPQQCGKIGQQNYRYFVTIEATNSKLTKEGYVMENLWVDQYFQSEYGSATGIVQSVDSCESMAQKAIKHFHAKFYSKGAPCKGINVIRILVRIYGTDVSFIEAEWKK